jgi:hypothetical protein
MRGSCGVGLGPPLFKHTCRWWAKAHPTVHRTNPQRDRSCRVGLGPPLFKQHLSIGGPRPTLPRPIRRKNAGAYVAMERRPRPLRHTRNQAVFDRVEVHVVDVMTQIAFVSDEVFPIAALPDAAFSFHHLRITYSLAPRNAPRKCGFDVRPTCREPGIARWQSPDAMQVFR